MNKLYDIHGFNTYDEGVDYESMCVGKFILEKNGIFEGVLSDSITHKLHLIKGKITDKKIEMYYFSDNDNEVCKKYICEKLENVYDGFYEATDGFTSVPIGGCTFNIIKAEKTREVDNKEIENLSQKINLLKNNLGEDGKRIYSDNLIQEVKSYTKK